MNAFEIQALINLIEEATTITPTTKDCDEWHEQAQMALKSLRRHLKKETKKAA